MPDFIQKFLAGRLRGIGAPIEHSEPYADLHDQDPQRAAMIENVLMTYAHGECHTLTQALANLHGLSEVAIITDWIGIPIHSGILSSNSPHILDANGIHSFDECLAYWRDISGGECSVRIVHPDMLQAFCSADEDDFQLALEDFQIFVGFMVEKELVKEKILPYEEISFEPSQ